MMTADNRMMYTLKGGTGEMNAGLVLRFRVSQVRLKR